MADITWDSLMGLLNCSRMTITNRFRVAESKGQPRSLVGICAVESPVAHIGALVLTGEIETTEAGRAHTRSVLADYNITWELEP